MPKPQKTLHAAKKTTPRRELRANRGIPFRPSEWREIEAGAETACLPKSVFVRQSAIQAARRLNGDDET